MSISSSIARPLRFGIAALLIAIAGAQPSLARDCGNGPGGFGSWLAGFKSRAIAAGVSPRAISQGLDGVSYDPRIIHLDRNQKSFKLSFEQFYARRVGSVLVGAREPA